ncbi:MAG: hypothetical protein N2109_11710 [Fimbriimonadales bacterium]|nr:hypothetical protein [Fimbriimonadales bacterium]
MDRRLLALLSLLLALALTGCGASLEKRLVGTYTASFEQPANAKNDPASQFARNFAQMLAGSSTLELREDKTFKMTLIAMPIEGKWSLEGNTLSLKAESVMGMPPDQLRTEAAKKGQSLPSSADVNRPQTFTVDPDKLTLTSNESGSDAVRLVFRRKE